MKRVKLRQLYPISALFVLKRNLRGISLLMLAVITSLGFALALYSPDGYFFSTDRDDLFLKKLVLTGIIATVVIGKILYEALYWLRYDYFIENGRLHIETGVLMRQEASVPLTFLSEFYLEQDWLDFLLGTRELKMKTALGEGQEVARIEALKVSCARALRNFLISNVTDGSEPTYRNPQLLLPEAA